MWGRLPGDQWLTPSRTTKSSGPVTLWLVASAAALPMEGSASLQTYRAGTGQGGTAALASANVVWYQLRAAARVRGWTCPPCGRGSGPRRGGRSETHPLGITHYACFHQNIACRLPVAGLQRTRPLSTCRRPSQVQASGTCAKARLPRVNKSSGLNVRQASTLAPSMGRQRVLMM
jgi:hypothetical protein